jgi:hypothetical protein
LFFKDISSNLATNAKFLVGDALSPYTINCNTSSISSNETIIWVQSLNKGGVYYVQTDSRISQNGSQLSFSTLNLIDEEYYGCGVIDSSTNKFKLLSSYYLFVRGKSINKYFF